MTITAFSQIITKLTKEEQRSFETLHLTANENILSSTALQLITGPLYGRYHLGNGNKREFKRFGAEFLGLIFKSLPAVYELESQAQRATQQLFNAEYADLRTLSGVHAIISTIAALTKPGDLVYCLTPSEGGHFATTSIIQRLGRNCGYLPWDNARSDFDLDRIAVLFKQQAPDCIYLDHSNALFPLNLSKLRECAGSDVTIVYDGSHPLGLIAGGTFRNPLDDGCDVLQGNTHKSFPGPQKGIILTRSSTVWEKLTNTIDTFVSNQHSGDTLALYVTMLEMEEFGRKYAQRTVRNAQVLAESLKQYGFDVFGRDGTATESHQLLIQGYSGDQHVRAAMRLLECGISVNAKVTLGRKVIRLGVQEATRLGMTEVDMRQIGEFFNRILIWNEAAGSVRSDIADFKDGFDRVAFSFDKDLKQSVPAWTIGQEQKFEHGWNR